MTAVLLLAGSGSSCMPPEWGAEAVLRPQRRAVEAVPDIAYDEVSFAGADGIVLRGWRFRASGERRGVLVYLHGSGDNRQGGIGLAKRFAPKGWDVLAYDSRAHGGSGGSVCTYGVLEKRDLREGARRGRGRPGRPVWMLARRRGGAAGRAARPRIRGVIAQTSFSSLEEIARDRAPWFATAGEVERALAIAGKKGRLRSRCRIAAGRCAERSDSRAPDPR